MINVISGKGREYWPDIGMRRTIFSQRAQRNAESAETKRVPVMYAQFSALSAFLCALCENPVYACLNKDKFSWDAVSFQDSHLAVFNIETAFSAPLCYFCRPSRTDSLKPTSLFSSESVYDRGFGQVLTMKSVYCASAGARLRARVAGQARL